jgi:hypothetical protein
MTVKARRHQCDEALEALLGVLDVIDAASSTLTEVENAIHEMAGGDTHDPRYPLPAEETRAVDLRVALGVVNAWLTKRNDLSTWHSESDLSEVDPDGLRAALDV